MAILRLKKSCWETHCSTSAAWSNELWGCKGPGVLCETFAIHICFVRAIWADPFEIFYEQLQIVCPFQSLSIIAPCESSCPFVSMVCENEIMIPVMLISWTIEFCINWLQFSYQVAAISTNKSVFMDLQCMWNYILNHLHTVCIIFRMCTLSFLFPLQVKWASLLSCISFPNLSVVLRLFDRCLAIIWLRFTCYLCSVCHICLILHTKFHWNRPTCSGKEDFLKLLFIYGRDGHLSYVTELIWIHFRSCAPKSFI